MKNDNIQEKGDSLFSFSLDMNDDNSNDEFDINKIIEPLTSILETIHTSPRKMVVSNTSEGLACACPFCGDSEVDENAKRGNFYFDSMFYHCFNCGEHMSFDKFFNTYKELCDINMTDIHKIKYYRKRLQKRLAKSSFEFLDKKTTSKYSISIDDIRNSFGFINIWGTNAQDYLESRLQTEMDNYLYDPKFNNIILLNKDLNDNIIAFQVRKLKEKGYFTYNLKKIYEKMGKEIPDDEEFERISKYSTIFGISDIDFNNKVTVFEGVFDKNLYYNSISLSTANRGLPFDIDNIQYWYDRDSTGISKSIKKLKEGHHVFLWKKYLEDNNCYDLINHKKVDLNKLIIYSKENNLKLNSFGSYFSNSTLNIMDI